MDASFVKALDIISDMSPLSKKTVGDIMVESGILSNEFLYIHDGEASLYHDDTEDSEIIAKRWKRVLSFIGLIKNLEIENLIFLQTSSQGNWVYGKDLTKFQSTQVPNEYELAEHTKIAIKDTGATIRKGDRTYTEISINSDISKTLFNYIVSSVYPGEDYAKYKERRYTTPMEYSLNLARKANNWAIRAFIIAIISFILSPFLFNWFGYSTIKDSQFKQLLDSISQCAQSYSSVALIPYAGMPNDSSATFTNTDQHHVLREKQK